MVIALALASCVMACNTFAQSPAKRVEAIKRSSEAVIADVRKLDDQKPTVVSESLVMNTVRQYAKRADLTGALAERSAEAKVWEKKFADGDAQRMRVRNPYDTATYDKYYDKKGDWQFSVIENDYKAAEKIRSDWNSAYSRARATVDDLRRESEALAAGGTLSSSALSELTGMMSSATARLDQFGAPPPELLPRPVAGADNSPFPTYKAFDSYTGKVVDMGRTGTGGKRRPVDGESQVDAPARPEAQSNGGDGAGLAGRVWELDYYGFPLVIKLQAGGLAEGFYNRQGTPRQGRWAQDDKNVTVVLPSSGRPGYASYSEGFTVKGRIGPDGQLQVSDIKKDVK